MSEEDSITANSTKEEVSEYFAKKFRIKEEAKNNIIKEDISGDILKDLDDKDFKKLGIGLGPLKKIQAFLKDNKDKIGEKEIKEKITIISSSEEVSNFFKNCLNFSGELNDMDGKGLIELDNEAINKMGLNMGQSKKLINYINYFKTLKVEILEKKEIIITKESTNEQVAEFLKNELNFSAQAIEALDLDGETLLTLEESEIDNQDDLTEEEKEKLKNYLKKIKEPNQESEKEKIILTKESTKEQVAEFLKNELNFSEKAIEALDLDGETLLTLEESDIDNEDDLTEEEKEKLKNYLKEQINLNPKEESEKNEQNIDSKKNEEIKDEEKENKEKEEKEKIEKENFEKEKQDKEKIKKEKEEKEKQEKEKQEKEKQEKEKQEKEEEKEKEKEKEKEEKEKHNLEGKVEESKDIKINKPAELPPQNENKKLLEQKLKNESIPAQKNKNHEGKKVGKVEKKPISRYKISPLITDEKYNIFFVFLIKEKEINNLSLATYVDDSYFLGLVRTSYIMYNHYYIYEDSYKNTNKEDIKCFIVQVPSSKKIQKLIIDLYINGVKYQTNLSTKNKSDNYFYLNNLDNQITLKSNGIFKYYLNYFFRPEINQNDLKMNLSQALMKKVEEGNIELDVVNILKFFKACKENKLEPKYIDNIDALINEKKYRRPLNKDLFLSSDDIELLTSKNKKEKTKLMKLISKVYAYYENNFLMELLKSKNGEECSRILLDFLIGKELKIDDFSFQNEEERNNLQLNLLHVTRTKDEINYVIKISEGLENSLKFINQNHKEINDLIEKISGIFQRENNFLSLESPKLADNLDNIFDLFTSIINLSKARKYKIINYAEILEDLIKLYKNESLDRLCQLDKFVKLLNEQKIKINTYDYHIAVHNKGKILIRNGAMKVEDIINFISKQDIFYMNPIYKNNENREPEIFNYIPITDEDKNYLAYIELIKKNNLVGLFSDSNNDLQKRFFDAILAQIKKFIDLKSIFDLYEIKDINYQFNLLINGKFGEEFMYTALGEKNENLIFEILDNVLICNNKNGLDLKYILGRIQINYEFPSKYYFYLLKNDKLFYIVSKLKEFILNFFYTQLYANNANAETFISLILCTKDDGVILYFLNEMNKMISNENDFYQKGETQNFVLFKLFYEKCKHLLNNKNISNGNFIKKSNDLKNKIYNDLNNFQIKYGVMINLMDKNEKDSFYKKILVITDEKEEEAKKIYDAIEKNLNICKNKFEKFEVIEEFYNTFYGISKKDLINVIKDKLNEYKQKNIDEILKINENKLINFEGFNYNEALESSKNIKYKNSLFFMSIYRKKYDKENPEKSEEDIFNESLDNFKDTIKRIILQKESKEPFFKINNVHDIIETIQKNNDNFENEIKFIQDEFEELNKKEYIQNDLLHDLINFSIKDKIIKLLKGIIYFIEVFNKIKPIEITDFIKTIKEALENVESEEVNGEQIKNAKNLIEKLNYDITKETAIVKFYELLLGKEEALLFLKKIKDSNLEIRNLNEFIDETENSQLQTTDIDNLMDVYTFFNSLINNQEIKTDENLLLIFRKNFDAEQNIIIKLKGYIETCGEIIQLYQTYDENPEMTIQKIEKLLKDSTIEIYKDKKSEIFIYKIIYKNIKDEKAEIVETGLKELEELRNKLMMSSTNSNAINNENKSKEKIVKEFLNIIDNIMQLTNTLNILQRSGYPNVINLTLKVNNSKVIEENDDNEENIIQRDLEQIIEYYNETNKKFKKSIKKGYENYPFLRLFFGKQLASLHSSATKRNADISHLINSVTLNQVKDLDIDFNYNYEVDSIQNINKYLEKLFKKNNINLDNIYNNNKVKDELNLEPGLYRKIKAGDNAELINTILNIYLNITGNLPIINTLLICNEETNIEKIKSFLYRAINCNKPVLFLISNMECLELKITQNIIKTLKMLYKAKNNKINSYIVFIYEKLDSGLVRDIEKIIPEKNILNNSFLNSTLEKKEEFEKVEVYSSTLSGYGKTTEIKYKVKELQGEYHYLPIGGSFSRNYVVNNLKNLNLDLRKGKTTYLHIDLSETDNDDLLNEILFKLIILRYLDSNEKVFYLGNDIHIILEIPKGFIEFDKKYKLLNKFKKIHIGKLSPLRLEDNIRYIRDSPISIVAEGLYLYDNNSIRTVNIDLNAPIRKSAEECEKIINKYFNVENQSYYQKMNFIKILSIQFKKFTINPYFGLIIPPEDQKMYDLRKLIIKNFIELTKVFTRSPFDNVLLKQVKSMELFGKYDDAQAIEDGIKDLSNEDEKQEVFSFKKIKPSLIFFNRDGGSISIISNANKNDPEYKDFKELWDSQNMEQNGNKDLVDYKNLEHEAFLEQIQKVFDLKKMTKEDIKNLCVKLGNYIFVSDNFIKMVRILLNIEAKIPVILMGETGVGKTKLLEMLTTLYNQGTQRMKKLQIHAGTTDQKIVEFIEEVEKEVKLEIEKKKKNNEEVNENELTWIFFDEINTCNSLGLITEIMCNHTYLGKKINENFVFLGACNPYRIITKKMRESGLVYYNQKEKSNILNNLVYTVNPLPHALLNFVFDFGSLEREDEKKYIKNTIISILDKIEAEGKIKNIDINQKTNLINEIIDTIVICHDFIREKYDKSSVSMREIRRFGIFYEYFLDFFKKYESTFKKMKLSLNLTLYLCYYLRLNDKEYRKELAKCLNKFFNNNFIAQPEAEIKLITSEMSIEKGKGIALNRALRENLFTCFVCIDNNIPLIIIGKPGTGKSLSFQILYNTLKGEYSERQIFKEKGKLYRYYYQGSETSTAEGIEQVFEKAIKSQQKNKGKKIITLVFFDEMGLAERSSNNPLKVIHYLLERDSKNSVPFLGISNWRLDAAKINRALSLTITDYDIEDLEETAISIAKALDEELSIKYKDFFETLARTYNEYIIYNQNSIKENKDFHGNRDFYTLIKTAMRELIKRKNELPQNEKKILTEIGILCLDRNFGGLENSSNKIKEIFKNEYGHKYDENIEINKNFSVLEAIQKNISDSNSRYLMLISEGNDASDIAKYLLNSIGKVYIELVGSKYKKDLKAGIYSEEILNKIKYIMESDNILILRDLDMIYPSLYDLFNQNFTCLGEKRFARIAFEYAKISSEVNKDFHCIVIVNKEQINNLKLDPPFLNRFEKHIVNFKMLLEEKDLEIAKHIAEYLDIISSFNNEKNLKIDLEKLLINCKLHNIEGLIFKIKNNLKKNQDENDDENEKYEKIIIKEVLKKIVPTFCQDIMASLMYFKNKLDKKYKEINELLIEIYKESQYNNFESFFKNLKSKKNIIYTFSKITENIFDEEQDIENKFGIFNKQNAIIDNIQSIKEEKELISILKIFISKENQNLLVMKFSDNELNKINSTNFIIDNFQKENPKLSEKVIIFVVHMKRQQKNSKIKTVTPDFISFINDEYYQIFIDNLQGKTNSDVFKIMQMKNEQLATEYIENYNFIENKIFNILNYMRYTIYFQTGDLNYKNYTTRIAEELIKNNKIKELIKKNIKAQGKNIKDIIKDAFITDITEVNNVDFFEVINSKLSKYFCLYLLNIILNGFKENILNQIIITKHFDLLMENDYFNNVITTSFEKTKFNFKSPIKMNINANKVDIYNGLELPKSKSHFDKLIKYFTDEIYRRFNENEESLRKNYNKEEKISEVTQNYNKEHDRLSENIKIEMNKYEFFINIHNQKQEELKQLFLDEYLIYFIIKYLEKKDINFSKNGKILNFLKLILKVKLSPNHNQNYNFSYSLEEFIEIFLYTQGYKEEIKNLFDIFEGVLNYCENMEEYMINVLNEEKIKYEISERNKRYTKIVNINFFNIIESLLRGILVFSVDLLKKDEVVFFDYIRTFISIEANLQKLNKKFFLFSKEIYNIRAIIKIKESFSNNFNNLKKNYEKIINNLLQQTILLYENDFNNLYNVISDLIKIIDESFKEKGENYSSLLFNIFRQQYKNVNDEEIRIKLIEKFFQNKSLIKKSKIFLCETLKDLRPEVFNEKNKKKETPDVYLNNFMNLTENKKILKYQNLIKIYNSIKSEEFNEILLYFLEGQCQSYFSDILFKYKNEYTEKCCEELLLKLSLDYLKKAINYLYLHKNDNDNNLLKLYAIAYLKTYCYYYVEINYKYFDKCNYEEINKIFNDKDEKNEEIRNLRNIYIWRLYYKNFENFDQFKEFEFHKKNIPIYEELKEKIKSDEIKNSNNYIFKESFITQKSKKYYDKLISGITDKETGKIIIEDKFDFNFEEINNNFDSFYCVLVNKFLSFLRSNDKQFYINKLKNIYESSVDKLNFGEEGKILYKYLMNENMLEDNIFKKISKDPISQNEFEILLYSFRFILNTQMKNNKFFYNNILKKNTSKFIKNNFIPGTFPFMNSWIKSYNDLGEILPGISDTDWGYYICKDCGHLYEVEYCTYPMRTDKCPNNHIIGGTGHILYKKDIRVFLNKERYDNFISKWSNCKSWWSSFLFKTLEDFKNEYVNQYLIKREKGIISEFRAQDFKSKITVRELNNISYRLMNFILYSYLMGALILNNLTKEEAKNYVVENILPETLFGIIKNDWELLDSSLKDIGIINVQAFINIIFDEIIELMNDFESSNTQDKFDAFERKVNDVINQVLQNKDDANKKYQGLNNDILSFDPHTIKEIIKGDFAPKVYKDDYPEIKYYSVSNIVNINTFIKKFNSSEENKKIYALINILINKDEKTTINAIKIKSLENINNLVNLLLNIYSYKISREDGKKKILKDELEYIRDKYNEMNPIKIDKEEEIIIDYINPFIKSWDIIKQQSIKYKCRDLGKPKEMKLEDALCYFLVDDGDKDGGMFLASAYQNYIDWQNQFINVVIAKNSMNGILNSYVSQLEQEIDVEDASKEDILNLDESIFKKLNELILMYSMRNIFIKENEIDYLKYNDIDYNYDFIEEELGRILLPGIKKFKNDKIKFITYLFEGFRGGNSTILVDYNTKYIQRELTEDEKESLSELLKENNNSQFYNDIFASLQILMNEIIKENYDQNHLIYNIIEKLPNYIILNKEFDKLIKNKIYNNPEDKSFTVNALVSIFEYFEALCWKEMRKNILLDYKLELPEDIQKNIIDYFNKLTEDKIINKKNFTTALRRLISRSLAGSRQEIDIKSDSELKLYMNREDLWNKEIINNDLFDMEIYQICIDDIKIGHCYNLYNVLDGDSILDAEINKNKDNKKLNEDKNGDMENKPNEEREPNAEVQNDGDNKNEEEKEEEEEEEERDEDNL